MPPPPLRLALLPLLLLGCARAAPLPLAQGAPADTGLLPVFEIQPPRKEEEGWELRYPVQAVDINERGQIAGVSVTADSSVRAFLWEDGVMRPLPSLPGSTRDEVLQLNNRGEVLGLAVTVVEIFDEGETEPRYGQRVAAVLWRDGRLVGLPEPFPGAINDHGEMTANVRVPRPRAVGEDPACPRQEIHVWRPRDTVAITAPRGVCELGRSQLNNRGWVAGDAYPPEKLAYGFGKPLLFLWQGEGTFRLLPRTGLESDDRADQRAGPGPRPGAEHQGLLPSRRALGGGRTAAGAGAAPR